MGKLCSYPNNVKNCGLVSSVGCLGLRNSVVKAIRGQGRGVRASVNPLQGRTKPQWEVGLNQTTEDGVVLTNASVRGLSRAVDLETKSLRRSLCPFPLTGSPDISIKTICRFPSSWHLSYKDNVGIFSQPGAGKIREGSRAKLD